MFKVSDPTNAVQSTDETLVPTGSMVQEVHEHLVYVLKEKLDWMDATEPELAAGNGHLLIRFKRQGKRYVFRVGKHGAEQHKRTMLAYRYAGHLGIIPEKVYHDGLCVIEQHVDGSRLSAQASDVVLKQLAQALSRLHGMPAEGFGPLDFNNVGIFENVRKGYQQVPPLAVDLAEADLTTEQLEALQLALDSVNTPPVVLLNSPTSMGHGDLWAANIMMTSTEMKILDWDQIGAYPIEFDLAFLLTVNFTSAQREYFLSHYAFAKSVNIDALRWLAKRRVIRDKGVRLDKKLKSIESIDSTVFPPGSSVV